MKKRPVFFMIAAGVMAAGSILSGCSSEKVNKETVSTMESTGETSETIDTSAYYFGVLNVPYADFYYGEINHLQPEALEAGAKGQYDVSDVVEAAGYREAGIYDAVSSATNAKSTRFEKTYYEENGDGVNIIGPSGVHVAISKELYEDVMQAIKDETECSNPLIDFVSSMGEVSEDVPAEYKVLNSDGTLSETIGTTVSAENVKVQFETTSVWGNYQISFEGLEMDVAAIQGALMETSDGKIYGLEHLDNLWLKPEEVAFAVTEMTEPHGNTPSYRRFEDIRGKTITKFTYMLSDGDDISIDMDVYCKALLPEGYQVSAEDKVVYSVEGTQVKVDENVPEGSTYVLKSVLAGRSAVEDTSLYSMDNGVITLGKELKPGQYSVVLSDTTYADQKLSFIVDSGLDAGTVAFDNNRLTISENESGLTAADYIGVITSVSVNGEPLQGNNPGSLIFTEDGSINFEAFVEMNGENVPVFNGSGTYEISLEATGYPAVTGTVTLE